MADIRAILNDEDHDPAVPVASRPPCHPVVQQHQHTLPPISSLAAPTVANHQSAFRTPSQPSELAWGICTQTQRAVGGRPAGPAHVSVHPSSAEYHAQVWRDYQSPPTASPHHGRFLETNDSLHNRHYPHLSHSHDSAGVSPGHGRSAAPHQTSHHDQCDSTYQHVPPVSCHSASHETHRLQPPAVYTFKDEPRYVPRASVAPSAVPLPSVSTTPMDWEPQASSGSVPIPVPPQPTVEVPTPSHASQESAAAAQPGSPPRGDGVSIVPSSPVTPPRPATRSPAVVPPSASFPAPVAAHSGRVVPGSRHSDLQRNRDTSSRHRANKREAHTRRTQEIMVLQEERVIIEATTQELVNEGRLDAASAAIGMLVTPAMAGVSDFRTVNDFDVFVPFSAGTAEVLGVSSVSDAVSHVLLEFIAIRRGMSEVDCALPGLTACERARLAACEYDAILRRLWLMPDGSQASEDLIEARLAEFQFVYHRWDRWETNGGAAVEAEAMMSDVEDEESEADYGGGDDTGSHGYRRRRGSAGGTPGSWGSGSGGGRGVLGIKRCRRCHVLKTAGSGHRRSHCADGQLVSSDVPFREP